MIVFWLLGARMSYQNARVKWSQLNLMLPCAISFSFTPESPVLCFVLFGRLWKTEPCSWLFTNHELLLRYASSSRKQQRIICQTCVLFFSWFLPLSFFFSPICISCEASVDESTLEHTLNPKIFVCHSAVRTKKMVPGLDRASAHVCFKTAAHKL